METRHCDECKHFNDEDVPDAVVCEKNHNEHNGFYGGFSIRAAVE